MTCYESTYFVQKLYFSNIFVSLVLRTFPIQMIMQQNRLERGTKDKRLVVLFFLNEPCKALKWHSHPERP